MGRHPWIVQQLPSASFEASSIQPPLELDTAPAITFGGLTLSRACQLLIVRSRIYMAQLTV